MEMVGQLGTAVADAPVELPRPYRRRAREASPTTISPRRSWYLPVKTTVEWLAALLLLVATAPLVLALAAAVKATSRGPAFYSQTRLGRGGRNYRIHKLRTMVHDAEAATGPVWAAKGDCRITPIGRILRGTHLDELPQLWNVLCGHMSLIGPRPERPEIAARIQRRIPDFHLRTSVRPGVTGLAQMLLPADDPVDLNMECVRRKLERDLQYVREVNPVLDVRIALSTACFFAAAAITAVREWLVGPYRNPCECIADRAAGRAAECEDCV